MTIADVAAERGAKLIRANGIDIAYTDVGDGPPLMLLHGGLVSTGPGWAGSPAAHVDHLGALGEHFRGHRPPTHGVRVRRCTRAGRRPSTSWPTTSSPS